MITINLLPEEYRRRARTPMKMMIAISTGVAVNASLLAWWAWLAFGVSTEVETEHSVLDLEMSGLTPQVAYHDNLAVEIQAHASREKALAEITGNRVLWTKVMDDLIDVVQSGNEGVRHYIWFDDVNAKTHPLQGPNPRNQNHGTLEARSHSGSEVLSQIADFSQVADFIEDLADPALSDLPLYFHGYSRPAGDKETSEPGLIPRESWSFQLALELRSAKERQELMAQESKP